MTAKQGNPASPKALAFSGALVAIGVAVIAAGCTVTSYNVSPAPISGSGMLVRSALNEQLCWDSAKGGEGTAVTIFHCHTKENQRWTFAGQPDGTTTIVGLGGLCLEVKGHAMTQGSPIHMSACTNMPNQRFRHNSDGRLVELASGLCLTATGSAQSTPITIDMCSVNNGGQVWTIAQ
jgi:hypothetical protein